MRSTNLLLVLCLLALTACSGCAANGAEVRDEVTAGDDASGDRASAAGGAVGGKATEAVSTTSPMAVAQAWSASLEEQALPSEAAAVASSLVNPHVARLYRDGEVYRAVVAGESADRGGRALLLTLTEEEGRWKVTSVEAAEASVLWPEAGG